MLKIAEIRAQRELLKAHAREGKSIGVVPTMGALHEGHLSLLRRARAENDIVVMTLFVNPTQFNDISDFEKYPRDLGADAALAESAGVDYLFAPRAEEIYPEGWETQVVVRGLSERLEGASRPGHFNGVSTIVCKLLNITISTRAYFGEKDWQQLQVIRRMVKDLNIDTQVVPMPTIREAAGLAMSSRNARLSEPDRLASAVLSRALDAVQSLAERGVTDAAELESLLCRTIAEEPRANLDYGVVVHPETMLEIKTIDNGGLAAVAAKFGGVRLIDNRLLRPTDAG